MRTWCAAAFLTGVLLAPLSTAHAEVHLIIRDGHVDLDARDATVKQILTEWARVGQTRIVNGDGVAGGPVTLQLSNVPEAQALEILLRSVSGYMTAPRAVEVSNASRFDRILVMPTSTPPRVAATPQPAFQPPGFGPGGALPQSADDQDDDLPPGGLPLPIPNGNGRGPVFPQYPNGGPGGPGGRGPGYQPQAAPFVQPAFPPNSYPQTPSFQPQQAPPAAPAQTAPTGTMPVGVSTPGMIVQPPPQPGQPGAQPDQRN
jgi:hypothetical protein